MTRPPPDPERVVEAYELSLRYPYRRVQEILATKGRPISIGTVSEWVKQGAGWWRDVERLTYAEEEAWHRQTIGWLVEVLHDAHEQGDMSSAEVIGAGLQILDRHGKLTGVTATRVRIEGDPAAERPAPPPGAVRAIEEMRKRATTTERMVIEGEQLA